MVREEQEYVRGAEGVCAESCVMGLSHDFMSHIQQAPKSLHPPRTLVTMGLDVDYNQSLLNQSIRLQESIEAIHRASPDKWQVIQ